ncbi:MAG: DCC1-like thiol-disulfide oxidoreductase family protein [Bacteroidota bacterium]
MNNPVIFFDGECSLCNGFVRLLIKLDNRKVFRYSLLQSNPVKNTLYLSSYLGATYQTVIVFSEGKVYSKSDAIFYIIKNLNFPWKILIVFRFLPKKFSDSIYDFVSRNRYKIFGRKEKCPVWNEKYYDLFIQ